MPYAAALRVGGEVPVVLMGSGTIGPLMIRR
jgi:hypothetical protein